MLHTFRNDLALYTYTVQAQTRGQILGKNSVVIIMFQRLQLVSSLGDYLFTCRNPPLLHVTPDGEESLVTFHEMLTKRGKKQKTENKRPKTLAEQTTLTVQMGTSTVRYSIV